MVLSTKRQNSKSKSAERRAKQVTTAAAELTADIEAEVDGDNNSIALTSATNPPSDLDEDTDNKPVKILSSNEPVDANSEEEHTNIEIKTGKTTAEDKVRFDISRHIDTKPPIPPPSPEAPTPIISNPLPAQKTQSLQIIYLVSCFADVITLK